MLNTPYTNSTQQGQNRETVGGLLLGAFGTFAVLVFIECCTGALQVPSHFPDSLNCAIISFSECYIVV